MNRPIIRTLAAAAVVAVTTTGLVPASAQAASSASSLPRYCVAEFSTIDRTRTLTTVVYEDGHFLSLPLKGLTVPVGTRLAQPVVFDPEADSPVMTSLVITRDGALHSLKSIVRNPGEEAQVWVPAKPVHIGHGWGGVDAIALPGSQHDPYLFAVVGDRLNRYTLGASGNGTLSVRNAPHAATSGFKSVRSLTWTRTTTVRGVAADVLVGLDGNRLMEYTVPRAVKPRIAKRELGRGWGSVQAVSAGLCLTDGRDTARITRSTPLLARVGRDVRLYLDRDNTDGSGRDIANYGRIGVWPGA